MTKNTRTVSKSDVAVEPITPVIIAPEQLMAAITSSLPVIAF